MDAKKRTWINGCSLCFSKLGAPSASAPSASQTDSCCMCACIYKGFIIFRNSNITAFRLPLTSLQLKDVLAPNSGLRLQGTVEHPKAEQFREWAHPAIRASILCINCRDMDEPAKICAKLRKGNREKGLGVRKPKPPSEAATPRILTLGIQVYR